MLEKKIVITNEEEYQKFLKKIAFYRSFCCRFTHFSLEKTKEDYFQLLPIIASLNKKKRKERIVYVYQEACSMVDNYYQGKDFCQFQNGKCLAQRKMKLDKNNGCCRLCSHRTGGLCPSRNLACKMFYCTTVKEKNAFVSWDDILILRTLSPLQRFIVSSDYFSLEEEVENDLYFGLFSFVRIFYRMFKTTVKNLQNGK